MNQIQKRGLLITLEGIDGSGKSTLAKAIVAALTALGKPVVLTKEPGGTALGTELRAILQTQKNPVCNKAEFLLFAADRAQHFKQLIVPALEQGQIVISDRMADSSLAYQGYGRGIDRNMITTINSWAMQGIVPDLTIFLRLTPEQALARALDRHETLWTIEQEKIDFWQRVADGYEHIFAGRENVVALDAMQPVAILCEQAMKRISELQKI